MVAGRQGTGGVEHERARASPPGSRRRLAERRARANRHPAAVAHDRRHGVVV